MGTTDTTTPDGVPFIDITREFDAPKDIVWRAWTEPELIKQWLGPDRYEMVIEEYDVRDGGRYRYVHRDPESGNEYGFHGVFHGAPSPDSFIQTFEFEGAPGHVHLETATFEEHDGGTRLVLTASYPTVEARDAMVASGMESGLNQGFARLDTLLASLKSPVH